MQSDNKYLQIINDMLFQYLSKRSISGTLVFFTDPVVWVGTGKSEKASNHIELSNLLQAEIELDPLGYDFELKNPIVHNFAENYCTVTATLCVSRKPVTNQTINTRATFGCILQNGIPKISLVHCSLPSTEQGENQFFPTISKGENMLEQKLQKATDEIQQLYNSIPGAVFRCKYDPNWTIIHANDSFYSCLGYTHKDFETDFKNQLSLVMYPEDLKIISHKIAKQLLHSTSFCVEMRLVCADGSIKWFSVKAQLLSTKSGERYLYCIAIDITREKQVMSLLVTEKEKITLKNNAIMNLYNNMPCGILWFEIGKVSAIKYLNKLAYENLGLSESTDNIYEKDYLLANYIHHEDLHIIKRMQKRLSKIGDKLDLTFRLISTTSQIIWVNAIASVGYDMYDTVRINLIYTDITKQQRFQQESEINHQTVEIAATQTGVRFWTYDLEKKCIIHKDVVNKYLSEETIIADVPACYRHNGIIHPDDIDTVVNAYNDLLENKPSVTFTVRTRDTENDLYRWSKTIYTRYYDKTAKFVKAIGSCVDVTEQITLQENFKDFEAYQKIIADKAVGGFMVNLTQNTYEPLTSNPPSIDFLANEPTLDDFMGKALDFIADEEQQLEYAKLYNRENLLKAYQEGKTSIVFECRFKLMDGKTQWLKVPIQLNKNPITKDIIGFTYAKIVTEEKLSEAITQKIINDGYVAIVRLDGNSGTFKIHSSNENNYREIKGSSYGKKRINEYLQKVVPADKLVQSIKDFDTKTITKRIATEGSYSFLHHLILDGQPYLHRIQVFYIDKPQNQICLARTDITELVKKEQEQRETLQQALVSAQQANKAKTKFLSSMSHDIRTPINAIVGLVELAKGDIQNPSRLQEELDIIETSSQHLLGIINDVLDMSKIESGAMSQEIDKFDIIEETTKLKPVLQTMFARQNQSFELQFVGAVQRTVISNAARLNRVLVNVLTNASKYTPSGGNITLCISQLPESTNKIAWIRFVVSDNGIGITSEKLKDIFKPFFRDDLSDIAQIEGAGLGLSIVKNIVDAKGGHINVASTPKKGTTVTIEIPFRVYQPKQAVLPKKPIISPEANFDNLSILLFEDHPVNALVASRLLENKGAKVTTAANGEIGTSMFLSSKANTFDLIFMDIQMPIMNGYQATKKIRQSKHPQSKTIPIFAMSANAFSEDIKNSLDSGMDGYIPKPISYDKILQELLPYLKRIKKAKLDNS